MLKTPKSVNNDQDQSSKKSEEQPADLSQPQKRRLLSRSFLDFRSRLAPIVVIGGLCGLGAILYFSANCPGLKTLLLSVSDEGFKLHIEKVVDRSVK